MFTEKDIEMITEIIQTHVGFFNGWYVDESTEKEACKKAAKDIASFVTASKLQQIKEQIIEGVQKL